jgi:hypothetical protein
VLKIGSKINFKYSIKSGEPEKQELFKAALKGKGFRSAEIPGLYQEVNLD